MKFDLLFRHVNLATMARDGIGEVVDGVLGIVGGDIAWIGAESDLPGGVSTSSEVCGDGRWLLPGLIDCHTHLVWAGNRGNEFEARMNGATYADIAASGGGIRSTVRDTRLASSEDLFDSARDRLEALAAEGVTTVEIKSGYGLDLTTELKCLGVAKELGASGVARVVPTYLGAHATPEEFMGRSDDYIAHICADVMPEVAKFGGVTAVDAFCESIAFSPSQCRRFFAAARKHGFDIKLHADQLSDSGGAALIAELGGASADHVEYASEASVRAMAAAGTVAVLLPGAFYMLRETQCPPVESFRRHGVPMAVATDCNPGTSPCTSIHLMLNMSCVLFGLSTTEALRGATTHAAKALRMDEEIGSLTVGRRADLALFDIDHPRDLCASIGQRPRVRRWIAGTEGVV